MAKKKTPEEITAAPAPARRRATTRPKAGTAPANDTATAAPGTPSAGNGGRPEPTQAEIAEAAYFRHLRRGGAQGDEFTDWIEAERELRDRR